MHEKAIQKTVGPQESYLPSEGLGFTLEKHVNAAGKLAGYGQHAQGLGPISSTKKRKRKKKKEVIVVRATSVLINTCSPSTPAFRRLRQVIVSVGPAWATKILSQ